MITHEFGAQLEYSMELRDEESWIEFYRRLWPKDFVKAELVVGACDLQRHGVDRVITLKSGKRVLVDEKKRRHDYGDLLLEFFSVCDYDEETKKVTRYTRAGWAVDGSKITDYVVYAIPTASKAYVLPYDLLRMATRARFNTWRGNRKWYPKAAKNNGYWTVSAAVPFVVVRDAICSEMLKGWGTTCTSQTGT